MPERPPIVARGTICAEFAPDRLYQVEMKNGHRAHAVVRKEGPRAPANDAIGSTVTLSFSPFDMSRCQILEWDSAALES